MSNLGAPGVPVRPLHGMVVEDDMLIMLDIEEILLSMGISKVSCATGIESAVQLLESDKPDFALVDFHLGKSTSLDLAFKLQELHVPFAFVTALIMPQSVSPAFASVPLIAKPFSETDIKNAVERLFEKGSMSGSRF